MAGSFILFGVGVFIITFCCTALICRDGICIWLICCIVMLRYRTGFAFIKEMTYLFLVTAIALFTSVGQMSLIELSMLNGIICLIAF
ncbi:DUF4956 domain-containing protein (plasmid) [Pseudoalteromonas espejiana]